MKLSDDARKLIYDEFKYVAKRVREEKDLVAKNYFFSAAYAVIFRIFNLEFDPTLVLVHDVLQRTHQAIDSRLISIARGEEKVIRIPEQLFDSLAQAVEDLGDAIHRNKDLTQPLQKIALIGYLTTGNGYYLYQKGVLKI